MASDRLWWRAIAGLNEAEALAALGGVSGPADRPPSESSVSAWLDDWTSRAKRVLKRGAEIATAPDRAMRERSARIARSILNGARAAKAKIKRKHAQLEGVIKSAGDLWVMANAAGGFAMGVVIVIAVVYLMRRGKGGV